MRLLVQAGTGVLVCFSVEEKEEEEEGRQKWVQFQSDIDMVLAGWGWWLVVGGRGWMVFGLAVCLWCVVLLFRFVLVVVALLFVMVLDR